MLDLEPIKARHAAHEADTTDDPGSAYACARDVPALLTEVTLCRAALLTASECLIQARREARHATWLMEKYEQDRQAAAVGAQAMLDALLAATAEKAAKTDAE